MQTSLRHPYGRTEEYGLYFLTVRHCLCFSSSIQATNERKADMRRRSLSSGNVKDLVHLPLEAIGPLSTDFVGTHT